MFIFVECIPLNSIETVKLVLNIVGILTFYILKERVKLYFQQIVVTLTLQRNLLDFDRLKLLCVMECSIVSVWHIY